MFFSIVISLTETTGRELRCAAVNHANDRSSTLHGKRFLLLDMEWIECHPSL
jgi:hypothetical protein